MDDDRSPIVEDHRERQQRSMPNQNGERLFAGPASTTTGAPVSPSDPPLRGRSRWAPAVDADAGAPGNPRRPRREPHRAGTVTNFGDRIFGLVTAAFAAMILVVAVAMVAVLVLQGRASLQKFGLGFLASSSWDTVHGRFGAAPAILGTIYTSVLALLIAAPVGIMGAIFLTQMAPRRVRLWLGFVVELLAAVPSIVFGLWALFVLVPLVARFVEPWIIGHLGAIPLFSGAPIGLGYFTASLILAVMILPTITSVSRDVLLAVPNSQRDAMLALGATRWETTWKVIVPYARAGVVGAVILAFGRAVGETMAVQMVIGNTLSFNVSLFTTGTTMPATIVNQFAEASTPLYRSALIELALILLIVTILLNALARLLVVRVTPRTAR